MNTIYFDTQENRYGICVYKDDNEYGLVVDDGEIEYVPKEHLRTTNGNGAGVRVALWRAAITNHPDIHKAAQHYAKTLAYWLRRAREAGKTCQQCKTFKHFVEFPQNMDAADGYRNICKECRAENAAKAYIEAQKD